MAYLIEFFTARLDVTTEPPNPINPIRGQSFLKWLIPKLEEAGISAPEPDAEDWGWYINVTANDSSYLVGAAALTEEDPNDDKPDAEFEWIVQIHKSRSLMEKLLGKNKLEENDPLCQIIERAIRGQTGFENVSAHMDT